MKLHFALHFCFEQFLYFCEGHGSRNNLEVHHIEHFDFQMIVFAAWACSSIAVVDKVEIGLDQELAMPEDSFVVDYFTNLRKYLSVGPPVYFVITEGYNYSIPKYQNRICNSDTNCDWNSMLSQLDVAAERSNR